jgi:hypothetical protein
MPIDFPADLPLDFGEDFVPVVTSIEGTSLEWIESHCEDGKALLLAQFRGKPLIEAVVCALVTPVQELEDACWQLLTGRAIDNAVGAQLDGVGQILDLPRVGWTDEQYQLFLRAQPLALRSSGTWPDVFAILEALGFDLALVVVSEPGLAEELLAVGAGGDRAWMRVQLNQSVFGGLFADVFAMVLRAKPAGVRLLLEADADAPDTAFTYAGGSSVTASATHGYSSTVAPTSGGAYAGVFASSTGA